MSTKNRGSRESRFKKKIDEEEEKKEKKKEEKKEEKIAQEIRRQKTARQYIINKKRQEQPYRNKIIRESISHAIDAWEQNLHNRSNKLRFSINPFLFNIENVAKDYFIQHLPNDTKIPSFNTSFLEQKKKRGELGELYRQRQQQQEERYRQRQQQEQREQQEEERYRQQQEQRLQRQLQQAQQRQRQEDEAQRKAIIIESISHAIDAWEQNLRNRSNKSRFSFISPFFFDVKKVAIDYYKKRRPNDIDIPDFNIIDNIIKQRQQEQEQRQQRQRQQEQRQETPQQEQRQETPQQEQQRQQEQRQQEQEQQRQRQEITETGPPGPDKCPSFKMTPEDCTDRTHYRKQALLFHPNRNTGCQESATIKFQDLANFTKCKEFVSTGHNLQESGGRKKSMKRKLKKQQKYNKTKKNK